MLALVLAVVAVIHAVVFLFPQWYPQTYDDQGLTRFKIASEYGVVALYAASLGVLLHWARERAAFDVALLFAAVWVMALSEFFFTFYVSHPGRLHRSKTLSALHGQSRPARVDRVLAIHPGSEVMLIAHSGAGQRRNH